jgi:hypothetical protein
LPQVLKMATTSGYCPWTSPTMWIVPIIDTAATFGSRLCISLTSFSISEKSLAEGRRSTSISCISCSAHSAVKRLAADGGGRAASRGDALGTEPPLAVSVRLMSARRDRRNESSGCIFDATSKSRYASESAPVWRYAFARRTYAVAFVPSNSIAFVDERIASRTLSSISSVVAS